MTDPKNTEDQELSLDQLKDAAGGLRHQAVCFEDRAEDSDADSNDTCLRVGLKTSTPQPKQNVGGSAGPGGDDN